MFGKGCGEGEGGYVGEKLGDLRKDSLLKKGVGKDVGAVCWGVEKWECVYGRKKS